MPRSLILQRMCVLAPSTTRSVSDGGFHVLKLQPNSERFGCAPMPHNLTLGIPGGSGEAERFAGMKILSIWENHSYPKPRFRLSAGYLNPMLDHRDAAGSTSSFPWLVCLSSLSWPLPSPVFLSLLHEILVHSRRGTTRSSLTVVRGYRLSKPTS